MKQRQVKSVAGKTGHRLIISYLLMKYIFIKQHIDYDFSSLFLSHIPGNQEINTLNGITIKEFLY